jgi:hypothetical protein
MARGRGGLRCELRFRFPPALLLNGGDLSRPGRRFEEVLYLFKRALLLPA